MCLFYITMWYISFRIRACKPEWLELPMMSLKLKLYNVERSPEVPKKSYAEDLTRCLFDTELYVNLITVSIFFQCRLKKKEEAVLTFDL